MLHDLIHIIVLVLLEPSTATLPEGGMLIRALNVLTVKIVERSEHTAVALALLRLFQVVTFQSSVLKALGHEMEFKFLVLYQCCGSVIRCLFDPLIRDPE